MFLCNKVQKNTNKNLFFPLGVKCDTVLSSVFNYYFKTIADFSSLLSLLEHFLKVAELFDKSLGVKNFKPS